VSIVAPHDKGTKKARKDKESGGDRRAPKPFSLPVV
jgi:hypothetical protein